MVLQAIASVKQQTFPGIETIVIDDGSTDSTYEAIQRKFSTVRIIRLDGKGPGAARNAGVFAASGEILMFLDSDDLWLPEHAQELLSLLQKGFEVAYGTTLTNDLINGGDFLIPDAGKGVQGDCFNDIIQWCFTVPSSVAISKTAFAATGGFLQETDLRLGEDWEFFLRLAAHYPFGFSGSRPITIRKLHHGSLCRITDSSSILLMLERLQETVTRLNKFDQKTSDRFVKIKQFTDKKDTQWTTIQEWYSAMKKEKIL
jgi:glycosyltransferase involved in cell wall biosynthesis